MFDLLKIKLFGHQPVAKISDQLLDIIIVRDYKSKVDVVKAKLKNIKSDSKEGKNRISANVLKLAGKNINELDTLIEKANNDSRDIIMLAEYPRCVKIGLEELDTNSMKQIYIDDFVEYSNWLSKGIN